MKHDDIRTIVKESVRETLISLGFNPDTPHEMQKQMIFLNNLYAENQNSKRETKLVLIRWAIPTFAFAIWEGLREFLAK